MNTYPQKSNINISYNDENKKWTVHKPKTSISTLAILGETKKWMTYSHYIKWGS